MFNLVSIVDRERRRGRAGETASNGETAPREQLLLVAPKGVQSMNPRVDEMGVTSGADARNGGGCGGEKRSALLRGSLALV